MKASSIFAVVVFEHLSFHPEQDLIFCLKLVSIVNEAERIGDLAKSIAKVAHMAIKPRMGELVMPLRKFRDAVLQMFMRLEEGFFRGNEEEAQQIIQTHEMLKEQVANYIIQLAEEESLSGNEGVVYALECADAKPGKRTSCQHCIDRCFSHRPDPQNRGLGSRR